MRKKNSEVARCIDFGDKVVGCGKVCSEAKWCECLLATQRAAVIVCVDNSCYANCEIIIRKCRVWLNRGVVLGGCEISTYEAEIGGIYHCGKHLCSLVEFVVAECYNIVAYGIHKLNHRYARLGTVVDEGVARNAVARVGEYHIAL